MKASGFCSEKMNTVSFPVGRMLTPNLAQFLYLASSYINRELEKLNAEILSNAKCHKSFRKAEIGTKVLHHKIKIFGKIISRIIVITM